MSGTKRRRDSLAPSLFPFLAVLLCTVGALVLMLILLVSRAQSSAKEVAAKVEEELEWEQEKIQLVKSNLAKRYEESKLEIEKKRLRLQQLESHISELTDELERLEQTAQASELDQDTQVETQKERDQLREALEKQLAEAKEKLESKLKEPKGDKPIFAIIPYQGTNGTHRRPIYLECNAKGLVIQPEGVVLQPTDLAPPYGPGNPLDAVLRTIRAEYPSQTGSLTSNPYPLLVVRPSGIKHYMLARAAMSGWDDQFGYELVSEDLELAFPEGAPNLDKKIVKAIEAARERQAALVMAMPKHYNRQQLEQFGSPSNMMSGDFDEGMQGSEDFAGNWTEPTASTAENGSSTSGLAADWPQMSRDDRLPGSSSQSGKRGGFSANSATPGSTLTGLDGKEPASTIGSQSFAASSTGSQAWTFGQSLQASSQPPGQGGAGHSDLMANTSGTSGSGGLGMSSAGGGGVSMTGGWPSGMNSTSTSSGLADGSPSGGSSGYGQFDSGSGGGQEGQTGSSSVAGSRDGSSGSGGSNGSSSPAGTMASGSSSAGTPASGSSASASAQPGNAASGASSGSTFGYGSPSAGSQSSSASGSSGTASSASSANDPMQAPSETLNAGLNLDLSPKKSSSAIQPVAQSRGQGWAWRDGNQSRTAIVRAIWLHCYNDRWILRPDKGSSARPQTIRLDGTPMQAAEQLAVAVRGRVESWGVALAGGHWAPVLHVEVAADAENRFLHLQRLMDGSGIDVIRKGTLPAPRQ